MAPPPLNLRSCNVCIWLRFQMLQFSLRSFGATRGRSRGCSETRPPKGGSCEDCWSSDWFGSHIRTVYLATVGHWFQPSLTAGWCQCWFSSWWRCCFIPTHPSRCIACEFGEHRCHWSLQRTFGYKHSVVRDPSANIGRCDLWLKKLCVFFNSCFHLTLMLGSCQVEGKKAKTLRTLLIFRFSTSQLTMRLKFLPIYYSSCTMQRWVLRILDAVFVFGIDALNIPALGVEGAAWSTVASIWISCLSFCVLLSQRGFVDWSAAFAWPSALKAMEKGKAKDGKGWFPHVVTRNFNVKWYVICMYSVLMNTKTTLVPLTDQMVCV